MSYYVYHPERSYTDYLQQKAFVDDVNRTVKMGLLRQGREIVASDRALQERNIQLIEGSMRDIANQQGMLADVIDRGVDVISYQMKTMNENIMDLTAEFHWGFSQVLTHLEKFNISLQELIDLVKNPVQTAALNHFDIARRNFRNGLYRESLERIDKAINGVPGVSDGFQEEWRFHYLIGVIKLGNTKGDKSLVNLPESEQEFLLAARYSEARNRKVAAISHISAAWAAYCQGKFPEAETYCSRAIELNSELGEAYFILAKSQVASGNVNAGLKNLSQALDVDQFYALKAMSDGDFQKHNNELTDFLRSYRDEKYAALEDNFHQEIEKYDQKRLPADVKDRFEKVMGDRDILSFRKAEKMLLSMLMDIDVFIRQRDVWGERIDKVSDTIEKISPLVLSVDTDDMNSTLSTIKQRFNKIKSTHDANILIDENAITTEFKGLLSELIQLSSSLQKALLRNEDSQLRTIKQERAKIEKRPDEPIIDTIKFVFLFGGIAVSVIGHILASNSKNYTVMILGLLWSGIALLWVIIDESLRNKEMSAAKSREDEVKRLGTYQWGIAYNAEQILKAIDYEIYKSQKTPHKGR